MDRYKKNRMDLSHEIWAAAQLAPGEGIADGVARIETLLRRAIHSAITHCDKCGCSWLDDGVNPIGCPYCEKIDWRAVNTELLPPPPGEASSFGNYEVHTNEVMADYARANIARAVAPLQAEIERQQAEIERMALRGTLDIVRNSRGVAGYHMNGNVADWGEFEEVDAADAALSRIKGETTLAASHLPAEAADFKVDAERYRWVRSEAYLCPDSVEHGKIAYTIEVPTGVGCAEHTFHGAALPSLDEAIDAQIAASRGGRRNEHGSKTNPAD